MKILDVHIQTAFHIRIYGHRHSLELYNQYPHTCTQGCNCTSGKWI